MWHDVIRNSPTRTATPGRKALSDRCAAIPTPQLLELLSHDGAYSADQKESTLVEVALTGEFDLRFPELGDAILDLLDDPANDEKDYREVQLMAYRAK